MSTQHLYPLIILDLFYCSFTPAVLNTCFTFWKQFVFNFLLEFKHSNYFITDVIDVNFLNFPRYFYINPLP